MIFIFRFHLGSGVRATGATCATLGENFFNRSFMPLSRLIRLPPGRSQTFLHCQLPALLRIFFAHQREFLGLQVVALRYSFGARL
jgi:hypothetical protein